MALPSFFKTHEHRSFDFRPRYYNERKEKMEERINDIKQEMGIEDDKNIFRSRIQRGIMRGYIDRGRVAQKKSNFRLFLIIGALLLLAYVLLYK